MVHMSGRSRYRALVVCTIAALLYLISYRSYIHWRHLRRAIPPRPERGSSPPPLEGEVEYTTEIPPSSLQADFFSWKGPDYVPPPKPPYKPPREPGPPIPDPFPLLSQNIKPSKLAELLRPPLQNRPPRPHYDEQTPLLIGFTRNWPQLLQCVVSYIAAGWPASDIYVVENTGVMHANRDGRLTLQNPFYLNHTQLHLLGIQEVIITPTLLTFAQLQNFYTYTALERNWTDYFWSHQDLVVFALENQTYPDDQLSAAHAATRGGSGVAVRYSLYDRAVGTLQYLRQPGTPRWANHFFAYDHLTLVHRDAIIDVGGWDTHIPFYATDCDMYVRLMWAGYWQGETEVGIIMDVATVLDDVGALLRIPGVKAAFAGDPEPDGPEENREIEKKGESFERLVRIAKRMEEAKFQDGSNALRNTWQLRQTGGQGEPFARDPEGFETGIKMMIDTGRAVFAEKWGHRGCDIAAMGIKAEDAWRLQRDWDIETEGLGYEGDDW